MDLQKQIEIYEAENHRMHVLVDEYKGKCFRHGVLFKSGMGFDGCPACHWENIANKSANQICQNCKASGDSLITECLECGTRF